jgi:hypothetical protein
MVQALPDVLDGLQLVKPRPSRVPTLGPLEHARRLRFITEIWGSTVVCKLLQALASRRRACQTPPLGPIGRKTLKHPV